LPTYPFTHVQRSTFNIDAHYYLLPRPITIMMPVVSLHLSIQCFTTHFSHSYSYTYSINSFDENTDLSRCLQFPCQDHLACGRHFVFVRFPFFIDIIFIDGKPRWQISLMDDKSQHNNVYISSGKQPKCGAGELAEHRNKPWLMDRRGGAG
jgi:hypothetical protein